MVRPGVDVVVPVHDAREHVVACIRSVLRHARGDFRLVIVDDASKDPELVAWLDDKARSCSRITLLRNQRNFGFVSSANRGMRHAEGRDVLLLNSDTIVPRRFLQKLADCAHASPDTGIVTPFTNNGTICSIPRFLEENEIPPPLSVDQFATVVSRASRKQRPELVTAVGFCMYVRAEVIARIGFFDEQSFPRGYGEENDFSERAKRAGFRIRLCDDLFVAHVGRASFGDDEGRQRQSDHNLVMDQLHPTYHARVQEFIRANPLAELQASIARELEEHLKPGWAGRLKRMWAGIHS